MNLREKAARLPNLPGVYLFKDAKGKSLYVGKAKQLRARTLQYFSGHDDRLMVQTLISQACELDVTVTQTEKEALILENYLIKKYKPRYNVKLVDDSQHLHFRLDLRKEWPRYELVRKMDDRNHVQYFGPVPSASKARKTLRFVEKSFLLRSCSDQELKRRKKPCLLFQMRRCMAPCVNKCTSEEYQSAVRSSLLFFKSKSTELISEIRKKMFELSQENRFEEAAVQRDLLRALESTIETQQIVEQKRVNRDVWGWSREGVHGVLCILPLRGGRMGDALTLPFQAKLEEEDMELLSVLLRQWYTEESNPPAEILLPLQPADSDSLSELFSEQSSRKVQLLVPRRGKKIRQVQLAMQNAEASLKKRHSSRTRKQSALFALQKICRLPLFPRRIECFDNSNIQGKNPVAAMVTFVDGEPSRKLYRKFKIKTVVGPDDYASMREVLRRRFMRSMDPEPGAWEKPDLLVVDGGKGQLNIALDVLNELGIFDVSVIGLAKPKVERARGERHVPDKIYLPGIKNPIRLKSQSGALQILQFLRDEAHRSAIQFHRKTRRKKSLESSLFSLPGVGSSRKKALLSYFGSFKAIREASVEELRKVPGVGPALAFKIHEALKLGR